MTHTKAWFQFPFSSTNTKALLGIDPGNLNYLSEGDRMQPPITPGLVQPTPLTPHMYFSSLSLWQEALVHQDQDLTPLTVSSLMQSAEQLFLDFQVQNS